MSIFLVALLLPKNKGVTYEGHREKDNCPGSLNRGGHRLLKKNKKQG